MLAKANANKTLTNASNAQFIESAITSVALPDNSADCIISNCVINLVPAEDKQLAFSEMFRLLKPGGRVAISDILARKELTEEIKKNIALYVGCIAGASLVSEYDAFLKNAGFNGKPNRPTEIRWVTNWSLPDVLIVDSQNDLNVYFTAAEEEPLCCGTDAVKEEGETPPCCSVDAKESCCKPEEKETCCGTNSSTCACQNQSSSIAGAAKLLSTRLGITDFNEWAGKCTGRLG